MKYFSLVVFIFLIFPTLSHLAYGRAGHSSLRTPTQPSLRVSRRSELPRVSQSRVVPETRFPTVKMPEARISVVRPQVALRLRSLPQFQVSHFKKSAHSIPSQRVPKRNYYFIAGMKIHSRETENEILNISPQNLKAVHELSGLKSIYAGFFVKDFDGRKMAFVLLGEERGSELCMHPLIRNLINSVNEFAIQYASNEMSKLDGVGQRLFRRYVHQHSIWSPFDLENDSRLYEDLSYFDSYIVKTPTITLNSEEIPNPHYLPGDSPQERRSKLQSVVAAARIDQILQDMITPKSLLAIVDRESVIDLALELRSLGYQRMQPSDLAIAY